LASGSSPKTGRSSLIDGGSWAGRALRYPISESRKQRTCLPPQPSYDQSMPYYPPLRELKNNDRKRAAEGVLRLKEGFDIEKIPEKRVDGNLVLATWNIRELGGDKSGGRDAEPLFYIAEILSRFDLVAIQEVRDKLDSLNAIMRILGGWWKVLFTDVTEGRQGNRERTAFVYDSRKITFGGLAGEIVLPPITGKKKTATGREQIARTPMIVGFRAGWFKFTICTAHLYYGKSKPDDPRRLKEMEDLAEFLAMQVKAETAWAKNMIVLGDFNIFKTTDKTYAALTENGFRIPTAVATLKTNLGRNKHFDQIAFIAPSVEDQLAEAASGVFGWDQYVYRIGDAALYPTTTAAKYKEWRTYKMSDHLPLWVALKTDFGVPYLKKLAS
jgi:endonuclease/exonuclease/phosphatase family metal-dependent hydrolase